jgi:hypothetical protein
MLSLAGRCAMVGIDQQLSPTPVANGRGWDRMNPVVELTARSCVTMGNLRNARIVWAWLQGHIGEPIQLDGWDRLDPYV